MDLSPLARHRARYLVPVGAAALTAALVFVPQAASVAQHPNLPAKTAAQLLASLEQTKLPLFSGTVVESAQLGLPSINQDLLPAGVTPDGQQQLMQLVTLLTGSHTAQIAYGGPDKQRVAIFLSDLSEMDVVHNGSDVWTYSSDSNSVTHNTVQQHSEKSTAPDATSPVDPTKAAEQALAKIDPSTKVAVDRTAEVAGRPAYQIDLTPRDARTLVSSVRMALDAATSMPLRVQVWARNNTSAPAFSVGFTSISMSAPSASTFEFSQPPDAKLTPAPFSTSHEQPPSRAGTHPSGIRTLGRDWTTVFVTAAQTDSTATGNQQSPGLTGEFDKLGTTVPQGHLLRTALVTILVTNDNRILFGAVTPSYLQQVATNEAQQ